MKGAQNQSYSDKLDKLKKHLKSNVPKRGMLAASLGCHIEGNKATFFRCPYCKRRDATYFFIQPGLSAGAYCAHVNSCGDGAPRFMEIGDLADFYGFLE